MNLARASTPRVRLTLPPCAAEVSATPGILSRLDPGSADGEANESRVGGNAHRTDSNEALAAS